MTAWDKLWEEIDWERVTTIPFITERIKEIKAEGDRLQKEGLEQHAIAVAYYEKLEAIKTQFHNYPDHADYRRFGDFYEVYEEWILETRKILEGDDDG